jgi:4-amino-4-deoxy-L-arabinose transferase-like glycosyltransferase
MTAVLSRADSADAAEADTARFTRAERVAVPLLLAFTGALYLWNLAASGWANAFYAAAAQAGADNWTAMLFGSSDAGNAITVDKTPGALWIVDLSVRIFGLNSWSVLVPQALMGVASVAVLYAAVRRAVGAPAALIAGGVLALTPVAALIFRYNNPDALLVLMLVVGAYCVMRACEEDASRWWLVGAGVAVGFGFLAKMLQAFLVLPAFGAAYLWSAHAPLRGRLAGLATAFAALVVSAGWYPVLVELWPSASRPYIGGSQQNSIVELALGYNGFGRLTGNETGGLGNMNFDVGWSRLLDRMMGGDIAWLLPAALVCLVAGLLITRRAPRTDPLRGALVLWGGWLVVTAVVFSYAHGIVHPYYTVALAPAIGACVGIGATLLWRHRRDVRAAAAMASTVLVTGVLAAVLLARHQDWQPWLRVTVAVAAAGAAVLLLVVGRLPRLMASGAAALAMIACLLGPAAFTVATAASPHSGAIPSTGPGRSGGGFAGPGGLLDSPDPGPALTAMLTADADHYTWTAAAVGSNNAAGYQLGSGQPVMAVGGFNGTDPAPTLAEFKALVAEGKVHYFIGGRSTMGMFGGSRSSGSREAADIATWVAATYSPIRVDGVVVYDLTAAVS